MPARDSKIRVLYITHTAEKGGANRSMQLLLEHLPETVEPRLLCPPGPFLASLSSSSLKGALVSPIPGVALFQSVGGIPLRGRRLLSLIRTVAFMRHGRVIRDAIAQFKPDLVHLNEWGLFHAAKICRKAGVPVVMHVRVVADRNTLWVKSRCERWAQKYVNALVAIDQSVKWSIRECNNCSVIYNPAETPEGAPLRQSRAKDAPMRVGFIAGLQPYKGIWDLLEAARLLKSRKDIVFDIYGGNARPRQFLDSLRGRLCLWLKLLRDSEQEIRRFIEQEQLQQTVRLHGHVNASAAMFRDMDVLAFPSHLNGIGRSVFEAGVYGIPSVVCLRDKIEDIVEDEVNGLVVAERDAEGLARAFRRLADDPELGLRLGKAAAGKYRALFDARRIGMQMYELYQAVLNSPQSLRFEFVQPSAVPSSVAMHGVPREVSAGGGPK